jgi:hypothetical protein
VHKYSTHLYANLCQTTFALLLLVGVSASHAQSITWQALPFPSDSNWPGPRGQLATITGDSVVLDGQPARSTQVYTAPATINCDTVWEAGSTTDGGVQLYLIPTGVSTNVGSFPDSVFFELGYDDNGQGTIDIVQRHGPSPDTILWSADFPVVAGATNHVTLGVATNGQVSLSVNGQPYSLPSTAAITFSQFQVEVWGWQPNDFWGVLNATVTTPSPCADLLGTWSGQVNVAVPGRGFQTMALSLQVTGQTTNSCLLEGYLTSGNPRVPWGAPWTSFNGGGVWGNLPFTGTILDTGVIFNFGAFGQASATLDQSQTPAVLRKFILLSTGGAANGDTAVGDLTQQPSSP